MPESVVTCPHCRQQFELTAAVSASLEAGIRAKYEAEAAKARTDLAARERALAARATELDTAKADLDAQIAARLSGERAKLAEQARAAAKQEAAVAMEALQKEIQGKDARLRESERRELELGRRERELEEAKRTADLDMQRKLEAERKKIAEQARGEAEQAQSAALKGLQAELEAKALALKTAQDAELTLRKERAALEQEKQALQLEVQRKLDAERDQIRADARKQADEEHRYRLAESEKRLADVNRQLEEARRKAEQGSQQTQGEVLEIELERILRDAFPLDLIEPVPKGVHGGDVVQRIRNDLGQICGSILWESKRTKNWSDGWLAKLRDDGRAAKADQFAIMSAVLPDGLATFGQMDGVWVTGRACVVGVASALRLGIMQVADAKRAMQGQQGKMELVYHYLTGPQFRQRVEAIVESFTAMQADLNTERRAMERIWAKREKQIERAAMNAVGMHGDLAGIVGGALPELDGVSMKAIESGASHGETP